MKTSLSCLITLILISSLSFAGDFVSCPVDSTSIGSTFGQYIVQNTQTGYILQRQTVTVIKDITFTGEVAYIKAVQTGTVVYVVPYDNTDGGYFIGIKHIRNNGSIWFSQYNHVSNPLISIGDHVGAGQSIATLTKTPCFTSFGFSMTQRNLNSAISLPISGIGMFPGMFTDPTSELKNVCK